MNGSPDTPDSPDDRYLAGIELFNRGEFFEAHEVWEDLWHECASAERRFYQALIQAAVAAYHWSRGNAAGAQRLYQSGRKYMEPFRPVYRGLAVDEFWDAMASHLAGALGNANAAPRPAAGYHSPTAEAAMSDNSLRDFSGIARLFPLPNLVLFPHVIQGLHIFEPRYRQMTADALAGDGLIAIVMLREELLPDEDRPALESVVCLGQIVWHERLHDGKYNIRLRGVSRARIVEELTTDKLYRSARVELLPDTGPSDLAVLSRMRRDLAAAVLPRFAEDSPARQQLQELFDGEMPLGEVCDVLSYALPLPVDLKQSLLAEPGVDRRAGTITDTMRISAARADRPFPPPFSSN